MLETCPLDTKSFGAAAALSINNVIRDTKDKYKTQTSMSQ